MTQREESRERRRRRRGPRRGRRRAVYLLPNLITSAGFMLGFWSITLSIRGEFEKAALAIVLATFCDMLDGRIARATHSQSRFGFEFDSLSDLTAFGLAPALLMYNWMLLPLGPRGWLIAGLFALCAALRLARFNARADEPSTKYFQGIASTFAGGMVAVTVWFIGWIGYAPPFPRPLGVVITSFFALLALLMVSTIPYPEPEGGQDRRRSRLPGARGADRVRGRRAAESRADAVRARARLRALGARWSGGWSGASLAARAPRSRPEPERGRAMTPDQRVLIFDTTLRDGEQSPGCSMNIEEKLVLARQLERLGVDVIEAGFPIASRRRLRGRARGRRSEVRRPIICALARTSNEDVDRAWEALREAAHPRIHVFIATSEIHMRDKLRMSKERVLDEVVACGRRARARYCEDVEFSCEDATRSDWEFLVEVCRRAIEAGARTLNIPDTVGYTTPFEYAELISHLRNRRARRRARALLGALPRRPRARGRELAGGDPRRRAPGRVHRERHRRARRQHRDGRGRDGAAHARRVLRAAATPA